MTSEKFVMMSGKKRKSGKLKEPSLKVGEVVTVKLITGKITSGKVVRREGKLMLSCNYIYYHSSSIKEVLEVKEKE